MKTFGFNISNDAFAENSWYFRNALVRANYNDFQNGVHATTEFLEAFFENLLLGKSNKLKNRYMHLDYPSGVEKNGFKSAKVNSSKCQNGTLDCTMEQLAVIRLIATEPSITQKSLAEKSGISLRTIKRMTLVLQEKGYIKRQNGKRNGHWKVLVQI